jgi:Na+-transporting methylmalonyl-CoA/oxaloacetate decarboxylase gamma subunit
MGDCFAFVIVIISFMVFIVLFVSVFIVRTSNFKIRNDGAATITSSSSSEQD